MSKEKSEVPYGTLDLLILKTLETMGTMHGYLIARRIEQVSQEALKLSQGSIYPAWSASSRRAGSGPSGVSRKRIGR